MQVVEEGVLLSPIKKKRDGWALAAKMQETLGNDPLSFPGGNDFDKNDWQW